MQDTRRKEPGTETEQGIKERQSEATSKDTLSDLEESEKTPGPKPDRGEQRTVPSPDGQGDGSRSGRADGSDTSGPM
jgi:hypothetical protein